MATSDTNTKFYGDEDGRFPRLLSIPAEANTLYDGGHVGGRNAAGNAAADLACAEIWGIIETRTDNRTVAGGNPNAGYGAAGARDVPIRPGVAFFTADATVTATTKGYVFLKSGQTTLAAAVITTNDAGGTLPLLGCLVPFTARTGTPEAGLYAVAIGMARPDASNPELSAGGSSSFKVRGVVTANVATPTAAGAFTVAANDGLTYTAGQAVLLVGQTTKSQNGPYVVGTVATGTAALSRPDWYPVGGTAQPSSAFAISEGTQGANSRWVIRTAAPITIDTTAVDIDMLEGNWVQMVNVTSAATQANPSNVFVAAVQLKSRLSGIFRVDVDISYNSGTTADVITAALISDTSAAGVIAGANKTAHGVAGFGTYGTSGADGETMDGAGNLTYNGAAWSTAAITQRTETAASLTGLLTAQASGQLKFSFHGIVHNANGTSKTPFTVGNTVAFGVKFSATNTLTFANISMTAFELPSQ